MMRADVTPPAVHGLEASSAIIPNGGESPSSSGGNPSGNRLSHVLDSDNALKFAKLPGVTSDGSRPPPTRVYSAAAGVGCQAFVFGGEVPREGADHMNLNDLWIYNIRRESWSVVPQNKGASWPEQRSGHSLTAWPGKNKLILFGGSSQLGRAAARASKTTPRSGKSAAVGTDLVYYNDVWLYDIDTESWEELILEPDSLVPGARSRHKAVLANDNESLIILGGYGCHEDPDPWIFSMLTKKWTRIPTPSKGRGTDAPPRVYDHSMCLFADSLFLFGGKTKTKPAEPCLWELSLQTFEWKKHTLHHRLPPLIGAASARIGDRWLLHGGYDANERTLDGIYEINLHTRDGRDLSYFFRPLPRIKCHMAASLVENDYVDWFITIGGQGTGNEKQTAVYGVPITHIDEGSCYPGFIEDHSLSRLTRAVMSRLAARHESVALKYDRELSKVTSALAEEREKSTALHDRATELHQEVSGLKRQLESARSDINNLIAEKQQLLQENEELRQQMSDTKAAFHDELTRTAQDADEAMKLLQTQHEREQNALLSGHRQQLDQLRRDHGRSVRLLEAELDRVRKDAESTAQSLQTKFDAAKAEAEQLHRDLRKVETEAREDYERELERLRQKFEESLQQALDDAAKELAALNRRLRLSQVALESREEQSIERLHTQVSFSTSSSGEDGLGQVPAPDQVSEPTKHEAHRDRDGTYNVPATIGEFKCEEASTKEETAMDTVHSSQLAIVSGDRQTVGMLGQNSLNAELEALRERVRVAEHNADMATKNYVLLQEENVRLRFKFAHERAVLRVQVRHLEGELALLTQQGIEQKNASERQVSRGTQKEAMTSVSSVSAASEPYIPRTSDAHVQSDDECRGGEKSAKELTTLELDLAKRDGQCASAVDDGGVRSSVVMAGESDLECWLAEMLRIKRSEISALKKRVVEQDLDAVNARACLEVWFESALKGLYRGTDRYEKNITALLGARAALRELEGTRSKPHKAWTVVSRLPNSYGLKDVIVAVEKELKDFIDTVLKDQQLLNEKLHENSKVHAASPKSHARMKDHGLSKISTEVEYDNGTYVATTDQDLE